MLNAAQNGRLHRIVTPCTLLARAHVNEYRLVA